PTSSKFIHTWLRFGEIMRGSLRAQHIPGWKNASDQFLCRLLIPENGNQTECRLQPRHCYNSLTLPAQCTTEESVIEKENGQAYTFLSVFILVRSKSI